MKYSILQTEVKCTLIEKYAFALDFKKQSRAIFGTKQWALKNSGLHMYLESPPERNTSTFIEGLVIELGEREINQQSASASCRLRAIMGTAFPLYSYCPPKEGPDSRSRLTPDVLENIHINLQLSRSLNIKRTSGQAG